MDLTTYFAALICLAPSLVLMCASIDIRRV